MIPTLIGLPVVAVVARLVMQVVGSRRAGLVLILAFPVYYLSVTANLAATLTLAGFALSSVVLSEAIARRPVVLPLAVAGSVIAFVVLKDYFGLGSFALGVSIDTVGLSYIVFRTIDVLLSASDDRNGPVEKLAFLLFFPSSTSGPIQEYRAFDEQLSAQPCHLFEDLVAGFDRIVWGIAKFLLIYQPLSSLLERVDTRIQPPPDSLPLLALFVVHAIAFLCLLYVNFSSYTDVAIGAARILGFELPENFDRPFRANGFIDFFKRWHMSLSGWFRTYVFFPLTKYLAVSGVRSKIVLGALPYLITFFLLGLWHGRTWPFLMCGALLGLGGTVNFLYQRSSWRPMAFLSEDVRLPVSAAATVLYISIAILGLWASEERIIEAASQPLVNWLMVLTGVLLALALAIATGRKLVDWAYAMADQSTLGNHAKWPTGVAAIALAGILMAAPAAPVPPLMYAAAAFLGAATVSLAFAAGRFEQRVYTNISALLIAALLCLGQLGVLYTTQPEKSDFYYEGF